MQAKQKVCLKRIGRHQLGLPRYLTKDSSGLDLMAAIKKPLVLKPGQISLIPTGFAIGLPSGLEAQIRPRSGLAAKFGVTVLNTPGTIDADYRGQIKVILINLGPKNFLIRPKDRIAQMVILPVVQVELVETRRLARTARGPGGFGHTGRHG